MKKTKILGRASLAMVMLLSVACSDESVPRGDLDGDVGTFALSVDINKNLKAPKSNSRYTIEDDGCMEVEQLTVNDLMLGITSVETGGTIYYPLSDFNEASTFPAGKYVISAFYGDEADEGFGKPYVYGETAVNLTAGGTTPVALTAELNRAIFNITYSDAIKAFYNSKCYVELKSDCGVRAVTYDVDSVHRRAYMRPDSVSVYLRVDKDDETCGRILAARVLAKPKYIYKVNLDLAGTPEGKGDAAINITFNDATTVDSVVTIKLTDAVFANAPEVRTVGATGTTPIEVLEGSAYADDLRFEINAPGRMGKVNLSTSGSEYIAGWPESIDLLKATDAQKAALTGAGLSAVGLWKNPDCMGVVDLKNVIKNIHLPSGVNEATVSFVLQVEDQTTPHAGVSDEAVINVHVKKFHPTMVISNPVPSTLAMGETTCTLDLTYDGTYISDNVKMQYKDENGIWCDCEATFTEKAAGAYTASLSSLPGDGDVVIRAMYTPTATSSNEFTITRKYPVFTLAVAPENIWAHSAVLTITADDGKDYVTDASAVLVQLAAGSGTPASYTNVAKDGSVVTVKGLNDATTYNIQISVAGSAYSAPVSFTTEAAAQLPNAGMESWYRVDGQTKYWWIEYPGASATDISWATMNPLTTSEGGKSTSAFDSNRNGCSYNAYSGTRQTTDKHSGSSAAIIETVGWGKGNAANGGTGANACKHITVGELYLGTYTSQANYGMTFASRPAELSFYYKYSPKNSADYGVAIIKVLNSAGTVIGEATTELPAVDAYTEKKLPVSYTVAAKAASLQVIFKSSGNTGCQSINTDNLNCPSFGNTSDGRFVGSSLYIDDITLNY